KRAQKGDVALRIILGSRLRGRRAGHGAHSSQENGGKLLHLPPLPSPAPRKRCGCADATAVRSAKASDLMLFGTACQLSSHRDVIRDGRMPKRQVSQGAKAALARPRARIDERHVPVLLERGGARPRQRRSTAMELAAEVERLEHELAAARAEMAALAARADV